MPLCSAFSKVLVPPVSGGGLPPPPTANKNWNPGNYIGSTSGGIKDWANNSGILKRLQNDTGNKWNGALLRFQWDELERAQGEYEWTEGGVRKGFHIIQDCLDQISNLSGKRLIVFFQIKTFGSDDHAVPQYLRNSATYADGTDYYMTKNGVRLQGSNNGEYAYIPPPGSPNPNGGYVPNMHVPAVRERFKALWAAFATKFNANPNLEAVAFSEASINNPMGAIGKKNETVIENGQSVVITRPNTEWGNNSTGGGWSGQNAWYNNMTNAFQSGRASLSNVQLCQWINSPRDAMEWWVPDIVAAGIGLGMPDMAKDTKGFNFTPPAAPGNIYWMNQYLNTAIRMGHASKPTLESTVMDDDQTLLNAAPGTGAYPGVSWSRQALATWSKDSAAVTHRIWAHNTGNHVVSTLYNGQSFNTVTDAWINNAGSDITVNTTRPTGW